MRTAVFLLIGSAWCHAQGDPEALLKEAIGLHQKGDSASAVGKYERYLQQRPSNFIALSNLGAAYSSLGQYEKAVNVYRLALEVRPANPAIRMNLGLALYKQALIDQAIEEFEAVHSAMPGNLQLALLLADCYTITGEEKKVIQVLSPFEKENRDNLALNYLLGMALIRQGRAAEGAVIVDRVMGRGETPEALLLMASVQLAGTANKDAIRSIERALELNPAIPGGWTMLGLAKLNDGNSAAAREAFHREMKTNPNDYEANLQVGALYRVDRDFDNANKHLKKAYSLRPKSIAVRYQLGSLALAEGKLEDSLKWLEQVTSEAPDFVEGHVTLATLFYRMKRKEDGDRERAIVERLNAEIQKKELKRN